MKSKYINAPSKIVQNFLLQTNDESDFDQLRLKRTRKIKQSRPFTDKTNKAILNVGKATKDRIKLSPLQNSIKNKTITIDFQKMKDSQESQQEKTSSSKQNDIAYGQRKIDQKYDKKACEFQGEKNQVCQIQICENDVLNNKKDENDKKGRNQVTKNQKFCRNKEEEQKENEVKKAKGRLGSLLLQLDEDSEQQINQQTQYYNNQSQFKKKNSKTNKLKLKKINYDGSAIFKNINYPLQRSLQLNKQVIQLPDQYQINQEKTQSYMKNNQNQKQQKISSQIKFVQEKSLKILQNIKQQKIIINQKPKNLLINFDDQQQSQSSQDQETSKYKETQNNLIYEDSRVKQRKNNIFLEDFGQSSEDANQQTQNQKTQCFESYQNQNTQCELLRQISLYQFIKFTSDNYVYAPIPPNFIFQTIIKRYSQNSNNILYQMFDSSTYKSILKAKKCSEGFQIFSSKQFLSPGSSHLKNIKQSQQRSSALINSNFFGTQFNCFKFNRNNEKPDFDKLNKLLTIEYQTNLFGLKGPRKMYSYIPSQNQVVRGEKNLAQVYVSQMGNQMNPKIQRFVNKTPRWNSQISAFVLNFNGRATVSSVKNFIITKNQQLLNSKTVQSQQNYVLFGKIQKHVFNLDVKYPFNLIQGLTLALSSFDKKIGCQ